MGTWGTGIYANDIAEDVRDACKDIFAFYDVEQGNEILFTHFKDIIEQGYVDNEYASFWYALADWQWKHGMLNEFVKHKTLVLLKDQAGIDEWIEAGNRSDILKRREVMERLKQQLCSEQCVFKKPKLSLVKPKHKVGEVIVFRADCYEESVWKKESFTAPFLFKSFKISNSKYEDVCGYNAQGKYMAILCIGTEKEYHSEYIPDLYDVRSVYVWYDYLSENEPSFTDLEQCGFLPFLDLKWEDFNRSIVSGAEWTYKFVLSNESFKVGEKVSMLKKYQNSSEVQRFNRLFSTKKYSNGIWGGFELSEMFGVVFEEKNRMELIDQSIDNLLEPQVENPEILNSKEIKKAYKKFLKGLVI